MSRVESVEDRPTLPTTARIPVAAPVPRPAPNRGTVRLRRAGEILVTVGVVLLLFVFYEVWVTNWLTEGRQQQASDQLVRDWARGTPAGPPAPGDPIARLTLPTLGPGHGWVIVEGTDAASLRTGPGHYAGSALPGEVGNLAVAGHRIGRGAPFEDLTDLRSCDPLVVETARGWAIYRVLPLDGEAPDAAAWASGRGAAPECAGVRPRTGLTGREVVRPDDVAVVAPTPGRPGVAPVEPMITLTTCHPRLSNRERLVVHGVLDRVVTRTPGAGAPPELTAR